MKTPGRGWAYLGALLGGAVSIAANVAHSYVPPKDAPVDWTPNGGAVLGAVFWPVALFVAIEILARVQWPTGGRWVALRLGGLLPVAVVAAVVSYRHLSGLLDFYGEDSLTVAIGPLAVDGLMTMSAGALIAMGRRQPVTTEVTEPDTAAAAKPVTVPAPAVDSGPVIPVDTIPDTKPAPKRTLARTVARTTERPAKASDVATKAAKILAKTPDIKQADLAAKLGVSERTLRRHLNTAEPDIRADGAPDTNPVNGHPVPELVTTSGGQS